MADKVGARFAARISGVTRFGLFVTVTDSGASGMVPMSTLPDDYWQHDEREQTLTGRRTRKVFRLAQEVEVRLAEASPVTGGMVFHILDCNAPRPVGRAAAAPARETGNAPGDGDRIASLLLLVVAVRRAAGTPRARSRRAESRQRLVARSMPRR